MNHRPLLGRRVWNTVALGPTVHLEKRSSLLIVGPTQSGKTSSLVVPAILNWRGAVVVTSVKSDVVQATREWRSTLGNVELLQPGHEGGFTWNPLEGVHSLRHALRVARDLTSGSSSRGDTDFWNALATKLVGALLMLALENSSDIFDVAMLSVERVVEALHFLVGNLSG